MGPMPLFPASRLRQTSSVPMPQPQISPTPVTTTRRFKRNFSYTDCTDWDGQWLLASFGVLLDVIDGVFDRGNFLGILVRNLNAEIFLESHDQLDRVERVGAQVVHKGSSRSYFAFINTELLDNDCLHAFFDAGHSNFSSGIGDLFSPPRCTATGSAPRQPAHSMQGRMQGQPLPNQFLFRNEHYVFVSVHGSRAAWQWNSSP